MKKLPSNVRLDIVYTGSNLSSKFNVQDKIPFEEQHDLAYKAICATEKYTEDYVGETSRRIVKRAEDHNLRDQYSHLIKHTIKNNHLPVMKGDFTILNSGYKTNTRKKEDSWSAND